MLAGALIGLLVGGSAGYGYALRQARPQDAVVISKQQAEAQSGAAPGGEDAAAGEAKKEDVVDAEFTEVDDDKDNKKSA